MSEKENKQQENAADDSDTGDKSEKVATINRANATAERLEKANQEAKDIEARRLENAAEDALGGDSEAGGKPKKESEDEKWAKDAKKRYAGTGMDPTPDEDNTPTTYS